MDPGIIALFWLLVGVVATTALILRFLSERGRNSILRALVDKGQPLPADLMRETPRSWDPRGFVVAGVLLIGLGVATALFGAAVANGMVFDLEATRHTMSNGVVTEVKYTRRENVILFLSLFPFCLGVACLVIGRHLKANG
jgi:hypothetical protein